MSRALARQRKRKNVLDRGKFMCLQPWQGGGRIRIGHKESEARMAEQNEARGSSAW